MNKGKYVFRQLQSLISKYDFDKCVNRYQGNYRAKDLRCWSQFLYMMFGQLSNREGVRDIINCLTAHEPKLYHLGIKRLVSVSTLTRANEGRDWRIWRDLGQHLITQVRPLYVNENDFSLDIENTVYALDASTIDLCMSLFPWAKFRKRKSAIKLHTLMDIRGDIPVFIHITDGKVHDVKNLDLLTYETGAFYVIDKGYYDFERLCKINQHQAYFVIRAKKNLRFKRVYSRRVDKTTGLRCDQTIRLTGIHSKNDYPEHLRRIKFYDESKSKMYVFLTNNFELDPLIITILYKNRWRIELFFKWIKQHLKIKKFWGRSENAVKSQIWMAICTYLLIAILKKQLDIKASLYEILQIMSVSLLDKTPVNQLLMKIQSQSNEEDDHNQLILFDL